MSDFLCTCASQPCGLCTWDDSCVHHTDAVLGLSHLGTMEGAQEEVPAPVWKPCHVSGFEHLNYHCLPWVSSRPLSMQPCL